MVIPVLYLQIIYFSTCRLTSCPENLYWPQTIGGRHVLSPKREYDQGSRVSLLSPCVLIPVTRPCRMRECLQGRNLAAAHACQGDHRREAPARRPSAAE